MIFFVRPVNISSKSLKFLYDTRKTQVFQKISLGKTNISSWNARSPKIASRNIKKWLEDFFEKSLKWLREIQKILRKTRKNPKISTAFQKRKSGNWKISLRNTRNPGGFFSWNPSISKDITGKFKNFFVKLKNLSMNPEKPKTFPSATQVFQKKKKNYAKHKMNSWNTKNIA